MASGIMMATGNNCCNCWHVVSWRQLLEFFGSISTMMADVGTTVKNCGWCWVFYDLYEEDDLWWGRYTNKSMLELQNRSLEILRMKDSIFCVFSWNDKCGGSWHCHVCQIFVSFSNSIKVISLITCLPMIFLFRFSTEILFVHLLNCYIFLH